MRSTPPAVQVLDPAREISSVGCHFASLRLWRTSRRGSELRALSKHCGRMCHFVPTVNPPRGSWPRRSPFSLASCSWSEICCTRSLGGSSHAFARDFFGRGDGSTVGGRRGPASLFAGRLAIGAGEREEHAAAIMQDTAEPQTSTYPIAILAQTPRIAIMEESWRFRPLCATRPFRHRIGIVIRRDLLGIAAVGRYASRLDRCAVTFTLQSSGWR